MIGIGIGIGFVLGALAMFAAFAYSSYISEKNLQARIGIGGEYSPRSPVPEHFDR